MGYYRLVSSILEINIEKCFKRKNTQINNSTVAVGEIISSNVKQPLEDATVHSRGNESVKGKHCLSVIVKLVLT